MTDHHNGEPADIESPKLVPEAGASADAPRAAPRAPGQITIMAPSRSENWDKETAAASDDKDAAPAERRRMSAFAAVAVLAVAAGAMGGALASAGMAHFSNNSEQIVATQAEAFAETVARLEADLATLKTGVDRVAGANETQAVTIGDRLDRIEKAQAEPAVKLARLTEAVEKLRIAAATPAPPPVAAAARDVTGSIPAPAVAVPKVEVARLPTVDGWVVRDAGNGSAMIEGRPGIFEVYPGDPVPGLGRVEAVRRQDGRWVVVTSKGLIVAR